jgi:hypothetical protein
MRYNVYTVFDSCAGLYQRPFVAHSDGEALRSFGDIAEDEKHPIGQHPEHYSLHRIGSFNDKNAEILLESRECLATALELKSQGNPRDNADESLKSPGGTA